MVNFGLQLHIILTNAYTLFTLFLGIWALYFVFTNRNIDGQYWGAVAVQSLLAVAIFIVTVLLTLSGRSPARWVYWLYLIYFMFVLPATYALLRGRDDRAAAMVFAGIAFFTFLANWNRAELVFANALPA